MEKAVTSQPLPESWSWVRIDEVADTTSGGTPSRKHPEYYGGSIPWVKSGELRDTLVTSPEEHITKAGLKHSSAKLFPEGTTLVALYGATVGRTGILDISAATNQAVCAIFPLQEAFTSKYMAYWLRSQRDNLIGLSVGGAQPNISQRIVRSYPFPLAPLAEQHRIVAEIEKQFTRLDAAVANLKRVQANLQRYKASVLKAACEGRLVPQDPDDEPAGELLERILSQRRAKWEEQEWAKLVERAKKKVAQARRKAEGRPARTRDLEPEEWEALTENEYGRYLPKNEKWKEKYKEPERPDTSDLPELPAGWVWASLEQCFNLKRGRFSVRPRNDPRYYGGKYPFVQIGDLPHDGGPIRGYSQTLNEKGLKISRMFRKGTVLLAIVGATIGNTGTLTFDSCCPDSLVAFTADDITRLRFLELFLRNTKLKIRGKSYASGGQPNINLAFLAPYPFPVPPLAEQIRIGDEFESVWTFIQALERTVEVNLVRAERLRQSILQRAFSGRLVPQDPDDEPASALLARIEAERASGQEGTGKGKRKEARQPRLL